MAHLICNILLVLGCCFCALPSISLGSGNASSIPRSRRRSSAAHASSSNSSDGGLMNKKIVCCFNSQFYYQELFTPDFIDPTLCTHINYEFAYLDDTSYRMIVGDPKIDIQKRFYEKTNTLKQRNPNLKVLLSIGGWMDSTKKYSELVASPTNRKNFITDAIELIHNHKFDGLDFAWEYPNGWQGAIGINPKDKTNFAQLLKEMRLEFDKTGLLLSISASAIRQEIVAAYDSSILESVNHVNVMIYDFHGAWETKTGHHAPFGPEEKESRTMNFKDSLQIWSSHGEDKSKIIAGVPAYGRSCTLKDESKTGFGAPIRGAGKPGPNTKQPGYLAFNEICKYIDDGWTEHENPDVGTYAFNGNQWVAYDSPKQIVKKVQYVVENGFGGILFKDVTADDYHGDCLSFPFPLLRMAKLEMIHRLKLI